MDHPVSRVAFFITMGTAVFLTIVPNIADWSISHIYHPEWTGHARFHAVWQLAMQSLLGLAAIALCLRGQIQLAAGVNLIVLTGFFLALGLMGVGAFEGGLNDMADGTNQIGPVDANLLAFSVLIVLQAVGLYIARRRA